MISEWYINQCNLIFGETITSIVRRNCKNLTLLPFIAGTLVMVLVSIRCPSRAEYFVRWGFILLGVLAGHFFFP